MKTLLYLILAIAMLPSIAIAHTDKIASFNIKHVGSQAQLHVSFATLAIENITSISALRKPSPEEPHTRDKKASNKTHVSQQAASQKGKSATDTERLNVIKIELIKYIKDSIKITMDGNHLTLGKGKMKLGAHQTDILFDLGNMPKTKTHLNVKIECFSENKGQMNIFRYVDKSINTKLTLSEKTNFSGELSLLTSKKGFN